VIYQSCGARGIDEITAELSDRLPIEVKTLPPEEKRKQSKQWLRDRQCLLVLDDVCDRNIKQLEPGPPCSVLYTSRQSSFPWISAQQTLRMQSFSEQEAEELFHAFLDTVYGEEEVTRHRAVLLEFAHKVEMLPIAVAVAASLLRGKSASPLERSVLKLRLNDLNDGVRDVPQLFRRAIASQPHREQNLLAAAAVCVQEGFWLPLAAQIAGMREDEADDSAEHLVNSSLLRVLNREQRRFQLHALMREQVRSDCSAGELDNLQQAHVRALECLFKDWETRWRDCRQCLPEIIPSAKYLWGRRENARRAQLTYQAYELARRVGELEEGLRILKQEESFYSESSGRAALDGLQRSYANQATILQAWGRLEQALALYKKSESICLKLGDQDSLQIGYGNQALILRDWGQLESALALFKRQEAICLKLGNKDSLQRSYGNQATILRDRGQLEQALALLKQQEGMCLELNNKDGLQGSYGIQATILIKQGREGDAMALLKRQEAMCLELGNRSSLQGSYGNQAGILHAWGRSEEALALEKKGEAICLELGNKMDLQISYGNQASILQAWGRSEEALALHKKAETICLELGNKNGLQATYGGQAVILQMLERPEEALPLYKKQEAICLELGNKDSLQMSYGNQAIILSASGQLEEALTLLMKQEAICMESGSKIGLAYCCWTWGLLARKQGDKQVERQKIEQALAIFSELKMPRQRDPVQAELDKTNAA
jgi:tetratricopeptide (TPR) repeat protein